MSKRTKIILIIAAAAIAAYLGYRWYKSKQDGGSPDSEANPEGLGSNLNSPAPIDALAAAPSVGPAVSIPLSISISHSDSQTGPEAAANPYGNLVGRPPVRSPLERSRGGSTRANMFNDQDTLLGKDEASAYATTHETG